VIGHSEGKEEKKAENWCYMLLVLVVEQIITPLERRINGRILEN